MYVCNCNGLSNKAVSQAIACGASKPRDIFAHYQCAAQCARCIPDMVALMRTAQSQNQSPVMSAPERDVAFEPNARDARTG